MIKAFCLTRQAGREFFSKWGLNMVGPTIEANTLDAAVLIVSDKILIDKSWRVPYDEFEAKDSITCAVIRELEDRQLLEEVNTASLISVDDCLDTVSQALVKMLNEFMKFKRVSPGAKEKAIVKAASSDPIGTINAITHSKGAIAPSLADLSGTGLDIFLDAVFSYLVSGTICSRLHDPHNFLGIFLNLNELKDTTPSTPRENLDYAIGICSELLPWVGIFRSKSGAYTVPDSPLCTLGFKHVDVPAPDLSETLRQVDRILDFRENVVSRDLRGLYRQALEMVQEEQTAMKVIESRKDFHKQWALANAELRKHLEPSKKLERWTDALTIPGTLASFFCPPAGLIPMATWIGAKAEKSKAVQKVLRKHPWLFVADKMADVALKLRETINAQ
jgi:hypothetical protein